MWKEAAVACFNVVSQAMREELEKNQENLHPAYHRVDIRTQNLLNTKRQYYTTMYSLCP
jgi:hypothetical protein